MHADTHAASGGLASFDFFSNYGSYMPRIHCLQTADGRPDWLWSGILITLSLAVVFGYARIFLFWRRSYLAEDPPYRNDKLMDLAHIFLWCAVCGYLMSTVMFFWPAYRLLAVFLLILTYFTWRFAANLSDLKVSLSAKRLEAELERTLRERNVELVREVAARTRELEAARAEAETANRAKSRFLAAMSHEIRTPLTSIIGYAELLDDSSSAEVIQRQGKHLLSVINDTLDMSKIEAGQMDVEIIECNPVHIVRDVVEMLEEKARTQNVALEVRFSTTLPRTIRTDPTRLRQILINLVGNALKFTSSGSVVVDVRLEDDAIRFDVVDTGVGMTSEQQERIFEAFVQASSSTSRLHGGAGLGLTIAQRLAELLGGAITVKSERGRGSTFTCVIDPGDLSDAELVDAADVPPPANDEQLVNVTGRILLIDDCDDNRRLVKHLLETAGAHVVALSSGAEALQVVLESPFDLVLMDMEMPGLDGRDTVRRLRAAGLRTPVVALTAHALADERTACMEAGCDDFVAKPIHRHAFLSVCNAWLARAA